MDTIDCSWADRRTTTEGGLTLGSHTSMYPYVASHTAKIHTLITLRIRNRARPLVLKPRRRRPCGFDSHRPLHFSLPGVSLRCLRTLLGASPSSLSLDAATVHVVEFVDRPSVEFALDGLIRPSSTHGPLMTADPAEAFLVTRLGYPVFRSTPR
jgi:hypothetical protein